MCAEGIACQVATGGGIVNIFSMKLGGMFDREDPSLTTLVRRYNAQHFHESPWVYNRRCAEEFDENLQMIDDQIIPSRTCTDKEEDRVRVFELVGDTKLTELEENKG